MDGDLKFGLSTSSQIRQCSIDDMPDPFPLDGLLTLASDWLTPLSWTPVGK